MSEEKINKPQEPVVYAAIGREGAWLPIQGYTKVMQSNPKRGIIESVGEIEVLKDGLPFPTLRSQVEVEGMLIRELPTPGMHAALIEMIRGLHIKNRVIFLAGEPSSGKSYLPKLLGRMYSREGALVVDCGGKNLGELLFEIVLDHNLNKDIYSKIDQRLEKGEMSSLSIRYLRDALGRAFVKKEGGGYCIDWNLVGAPSKAGKDYKDTDKIKEEPEQEERIRKALEALKMVMDLEGLENQSGGLQFKTVEGPLIRAWREGRPVLLDEYNKSKPGTDGELQVLWQVLTGQEAEHTVKGGAGKSFTFRRDEMSPGFFTTLTGNLVGDGFATIKLSDSFHTRVPMFPVPPAKEIDYEHRICQVLTGVPLSTFRTIHPREKNFVELMKKYRFEGLSSEEKALIPQWQVRMLNHADCVMEAAGQLAKFYKGWEELLDPENEKTIGLEVDKSYRGEVGVGMRMMINHLQKALSLEVHTVPVEEAGDFDVKAALKETDEEINRKASNQVFVLNYPEAGFGRRLTNIIMQTIVNTSKDRGKNQLYKRLVELAVDCGICLPHLQEAQRGGQRTIGEILDIKPDNSVELSEGMQELHRQFCDYLRQLDPDLSSDNGKIIAPVDFQARYRRAFGKKKELEESNAEGRKYLVLPNPELFNGGNDVEPFQLVSVMEEKVQAKQLVPFERLIETLSMAELGRANKDSFWSREIFASSDEPGNFYKIGMNEDDELGGLGYSALRCRVGEGEEVKYTDIHVLRNKTSDVMLLLGSEDVSEKMKERLRGQGITYVNRNGGDAVGEVNNFVDEICGVTEGRMGFKKNNLMEAIRLRNEVGKEEEDVGKVLVGLEEVDIPRCITSDGISKERNQK